MKGSMSSKSLLPFLITIMPIINIAIELPTNAVKAVRCHTPVGLSEAGRLLLDYYTNPISIFDLVSFGDIETLAPSQENTTHVHPPTAKKNKKPVLKEYDYEMYDDRDAFISENRTGSQSLFLYSYKTNRWEFWDRRFSLPHGWAELTNEFITNCENSRTVRCPQTP
jgi:hypothetical protein